MHAVPAKMFSNRHKSGDICKSNDKSQYHWVWKMATLYMDHGVVRLQNNQRIVVAQVLMLMWVSVYCHKSMFLEKKQSHLISPYSTVLFICIYFVQINFGNFPWHFSKYWFWVTSLRLTSYIHLSYRICTLVWQLNRGAYEFQIPGKKIFLETCDASLWILKVIELFTSMHQYYM